MGMLHLPIRRGALLSSGLQPILIASFTGVVGAALPSIWTAQLGAFDLDGSGRARGKTLAADGNNLVSNPEFTVNTTGWNVNPADATLARVDSTIDPGAVSGGNDSYVGKMTLVAAYKYVLSGIQVIVGVNYLAACRVYSPSANIAIRPISIGIMGYVGTQPTAEDVWETISFSAAAISTSDNVAIRMQTGEVGDIAYFDAVSVQATYAIATLDATQSAIELRVPVTMPASGVKPFGIVARYQDVNNYWLWRVTPGTAGTDFELIEVNAGTATQRASADVDWVAGTTYNLTLRHSGANAYTALVNGVSKLTYTDGTAFLATSTLYGLQEAGATNGLFGTMEVWPL